MFEKVKEDRRPVAFRCVLSCSFRTAPQESQVSLTSSLDTKEQVRQATDIVDLIGEAIPLQRRGRLYLGLCPWHDDTRPSFQVNPERQTFRCWVCDVGGDVFSYVMRRDQLEFREALEMLAERAGIELRPRAPHEHGKPTAGDEKRQLYRAHQWATELFHRVLLNDARAEPARRYLQQRGIDQASIERHAIGFSPNEWTWLVEQVVGTEFSAPQLERLGLIGTSAKSGRRYDRFKGRLLFPIRDVQGRTVAVGGRILPEFANEESAKYINSPETPLFSKSNQLYGLELAREAFGRQREAIVTEGYTDCVVAQQFGFANTVAVLGTALGESHVRMLSRYVDRVTLVLDGDEAGKRRANEILDLFLAGRLDLRILTLPDGSDPCDFLFARGAAAFAEALSESVDALEHKLRLETADVDPAAGTYEANRALENVLATLAAAPRPSQVSESELRLREDQFISRLARQFNVEEGRVRVRLNEVRAATAARSARPPGLAGEPVEGMPIAVEDSQADAWERELIEILLQEPEAVSRAAESLRPEAIQDARLRTIYAKCCELLEAGVSAELDRLLLEFEDPAMQSMLVKLDEAGRERGGSDLAAQLPDVLESLARRRERHEQRRLTTAMKEKRFDQQEEVEQLEDMFRQLRHRQGISEPTDE
ncbi:MAG: DNA primase [Planctomycetota bacterium]|nr:MAG: DNA primase [Planctomycetota bacterium]